MAQRRERTWGPRVRPIGLVGLTPVIVLAVVGVYVLLFPPTIWMPIAIVGVVGAWIAWVLWPQIRLQRKLKRHGRFICLRCFYPLHGLAESGSCPECGEPYTREGLARAWRMWEVTTNKGRLIAKEDAVDGSPPPADAA